MEGSGSLQDSMYFVSLLGRKRFGDERRLCTGPNEGAWNTLDKLPRSYSDPQSRLSKMNLMELSSGTGPITVLASLRRRCMAAQPSSLAKGGASSSTTAMGGSKPRNSGIIHLGGNVD